MNLIITSARHLEPEASSELKKILLLFGDENSEITITEFSGILTAKTKIDPYEIVQKIREMVIDEPWSVRYCLRIIPIEAVADTDLEKILDASLDLVNKIKKDESYRITIEKRNSEISSKKIISKIADNIQNKVSLEKPDWIVLIEILSNKTGLAVLKKDDIFSLEITKRDLLE